MKSTAISKLVTMVFVGGSLLLAGGHAKAGLTSINGLSSINGLATQAESALSSCGIDPARSLSSSLADRTTK